MTLKSTACCGQGLFWDPIYYVAGFKMRIGAIRRCASYVCRKTVGDVALDRPHANKELAAIQKLFNGTSAAMLHDLAIKRPGAPFDFEKGAAGILVPLGYQGELKAQPDLPDETEPPF